MLAPAFRQIVGGRPAVPQQKEFCAGENRFFDSTEFSIVDGTRIHGDPPHRVTDGIPVEEADGKIVEIPPLDAVFQLMRAPDSES
jgi:hypothetical protein